MKVNHLVVWVAGVALLGGVHFASYTAGSKAATREVESQIDTEHQQAIEDAVVCKLSLALTQGRLQRFEQVESEQLQSCCAGE